MNKTYQKPTSTRILFVVEEMLLDTSLPVDPSKEGSEAGSNRYNGWNSDAWTGGLEDEE